MFRCYHCRQILRGDRDQIGSRCPACRAPLYENVYDPRRGPATTNRCAVHPNNPAIGPCPRCGTFFCRLCRTRWLERWMCAACVERAIQGATAPPQEMRTHFRQALFGAIFSIIAWTITLLGVGLIALAGRDPLNPNVPLAIMGLFILILSPLASMLGVGPSAAAVRSRGDHMIMASTGLILSGLHLGVLVGLFTVGILANR